MVSEALKEEKEALKGIRVALHLNMAICHLKLKQPNLAIKDCEEVCVCVCVHTYIHVYSLEGGDCRIAILLNPLYIKALGTFSFSLGSEVRPEQCEGILQKRPGEYQMHGGS